MKKEFSEMTVQHLLDIAGDLRARIDAGECKSTDVIQLHQSGTDKYRKPYDSYIPIVGFDPALLEFETEPEEY